MISHDTFTACVDYAVSGSLFPDSCLHGEDHWRGVTAQGLWLADTYGMGEKGRMTALLFGLFHDCRRENDGWDPEHGARGAAALLDCPHLSHLPASLLDTLARSMVDHDGGMVSEDRYIGLGWDSDRSLLGRVGITPDIDYFSVVTDEMFDTLIHNGDKLIRSQPDWDALWAKATRSEIPA